MEYIEGLKRLVERAAVFTGKRVSITIIANPVAGGFTIAKRALANRSFIESELALVDGRPVVTRSCSVVMHLTMRPGHAGILARSVIERACAVIDPDVLHLVITAGGDGTSLEVQSEIARAYLEEGKTELANRICLLRLPFGTGNDGSDGRTLDQSLGLLTGESHLEKQRAIRVFTEHRPAEFRYAFNIASIGIDAFVTNMTNRVKNLFPGDSYKIWVDLACLFYNRLYRVGEMTVTGTLGGAAVPTVSGRMVLFLLGVSGHRTYGSNQKILPGNENVCGIREMSLLRKLFLKKFIKNGTHVSYPEIIQYSADRISIGYSEKILVQLDGEAHLLEASDFPVVMELTEPFVTILKH